MMAMDDELHDRVIAALRAKFTQEQLNDEYVLLSDGSYHLQLAISAFDAMETETDTDGLVEFLNEADEAGAALVEAYALNKAEAACAQ